MVNCIPELSKYIFWCFQLMAIQFVVFLPSSVLHSKMRLELLTLTSILLLAQFPSVGRAFAIPGEVTTQGDNYPGFRNIKYYFLL